MDHWGDPWADDAASSGDAPEEHKKVEPPAPTLPTLPTAPSLLNGFLDDAHWGDDNDVDDDFGGWATAAKEEDDAVRTWGDTRVAHHEPRAPATKTVTAETYDTSDESRDYTFTEEWTRPQNGLETPREFEKVLSETSDSATTVQADDHPKHISTDLTEASHRDDDSSTRPSTSPSDISHGDIRSESPRTSFEDERMVEKSVEAQVGNAAEETETNEALTGLTPEIGGTKKITFDSDAESFEDDHLHQPDTLDRLESSDPVPEDRSAAEAQPEMVKSAEHTLRKPLAISDVNLKLISELFPASTGPKELPIAPEDPIYSTSTRKAWYRLTRKQTMREFNAGGDENSYIRIGWSNSRIKTDVVKIVSRWANEDRISGRGPGGRASFFWDHPKAETQAPRALFRHKPSVSVSSSSQPLHQHVQTNNDTAPASFNWSSASAPVNPWEQTSPTIPSPSLSFAADVTTATDPRVANGRPLSIASERYTAAQAGHKRSFSLQAQSPVQSSIDLQPGVAEPISSPSTNSDPWAGLSALDTVHPVQPSKPPTTEEDDEWGEMVESPAVSTQDPLEQVSHIPSNGHTPSRPLDTPKSLKSSPIQLTPSKHASPIVRLKGIVSPTSSQFKSNSLVPGASEQMVVGPGLLRSARKVSKPLSEASPPSTTISPQPENPKTESADEPVATVNSSPVVQSTPDIESGFNNHQSPTSPSFPITEQPPSTIAVFDDATAQAADPWATADFSIFESAPASVQTDTNYVPEPFTRPPPRTKTPPVLMPLTGASNSAQRRKAEEDEVIREIVHGLPDLRYMLVR